MQVKASLFSLLFIIMFIACINPVIGQKKAPDFTLFDINGKEFSLSDYRGRVVLIDLLTIKPYCYYCMLEIPHLKAAYNNYPRNELILMSISVSSLDTDDTLRSNFVEEYDIPWIVACGGNEMASKYSVSGVPTLVIVDTEGNMRYRHEGVTEESKLSSEIDFLLSGTENGDSNSNSNGDSNDDSNGDSDTGNHGPPYTLIAIIGVGVIVFLVIGIVVAGQLLGWSEPSKKRGSRKRKR